MGRRARLVCAALVAVFCLGLTGGGLRADFSPDDLMNMHDAWSHPAGWWAAAVLKYWSAAYRPVGGLFYAVFFGWFGFNPLPFRLVCFALLACNAALLWYVTWRVTGREEAGAFAAALGSVHVNYQPLYYSTGNCYDIFCFFFYFGALAVYLRARAAGRRLKGWEWAAVAGLYGLALDSKELAVTLPGMVLVYEVLLTADWRQWRKYLPGLALAAMTVPFVVGKTSGEAVFFRDPAYTPKLSAGVYFQAWPVYLNELVSRDGWAGLGAAGVFLAGTLALCLGSRGRLFGWVLMTFGLVPIALVPPRGISAAYLPLAGLAMVLGSVMAGLRWRRVPAGVWLGVVLAGMAWVHVRMGIYRAEWMLQEQRRIRTFLTEMAPNLSVIPRGGRVLFRPDPFADCGWGRWSSTFALRMMRDDHELLVDRGDELGHELTEEEVAGYSVVFAGTKVERVGR